MILVIGGAFQNKLEFVKNRFEPDESKICNEFHIRLKNWLKDGNKAQDILESIKAYEIIISDEIGCGIVPMDSFERLWREECGRALCDIAKNSTEVWRVQCGIGIKIKG